VGSVSVAPAPAAAGKLWSIQYLRFVAAFGVIVCHACGATPHPFAFGAVGVDLFFVISGFVMWHGAAVKPQTPARFWSRRIRRIVPLYWTSIAAVVVLVHVFGVLPLGGSDEVGPVVKSLLFIPYYNSNGSMGPVVSPGWTLNFEMFFYGVFGVALFLPAKYRFWFLSAFFLGLWWCGQHYASDSVVISNYLKPICLEFWFGVAAAAATLRFRAPGWTGAGPMLLGVVLMWAPGHYADADAAARLTIAAGCAALVLGVVGLEAAGKLPRIGWLNYGGEASYALYLAQIFGFEAVRPLIAGWPGPAKALAFAAAALAAGFAAHRFVERPLSGLLNGDARRLRRFAPRAMPAQAE
jgi:exopolysaccharide production protein ExoZ